MLQIYFFNSGCFVGSFQVFFLDRARFLYRWDPEGKKRAILRVPSGTQGKPGSQVSFLLCPREADVPPEVEGCSCLRGGGPVADCRVLHKGDTGGQASCASVQLDMVKHSCQSY